MRPRGYRAVIYRDRAGRWRWTAYAPNGNRIAREAHGPGYASMTNAKRGFHNFMSVYTMDVWIEQPDGSLKELEIG